MGRARNWIAVVTVLLVVIEAALVASHVRNANQRDSYAANIAIANRLKNSSSFVAPIDAGPDVPPVGRSLFDQLAGNRNGTGWDVPFPFSKLLGEFAKAGGCSPTTSNSPCYQRLLIPLGRSLQRLAAAPEFFKHPRMLVAFTGEADESSQGDFPLLKDRLYLGYQEQANLIEVISFNEAAGRFEFQLVKNYLPGMTPQVSYANRFVCLSCHQNFAPLFSRQVWDETNANPQIAQRLENSHRDFEGFPIRIGVDVPNAFDDATDRANLLPAYELLWRNGCGDDRRCRARALEAALQYRLTNQRLFDFQSASFRQEFLAPFEKNWQQHWPNGLKIPSNDVPNRDPLQFADSERLAHVPARFEALLPRGHKEIWQWETDRFRLIKGIGEYFSNRDIRLLASKLDIAVDRIRSSEEMANSPGFAGLNRAIDTMLSDPQGQAAFDAPTIQRLPLRNALFRALDIDIGTTCCDNDNDLPKAQADELSSLSVATKEVGLNYFYVHCGRCHGTNQPFPPNFMNGDSATVQRNVRRCADRILYRLNMWQIESERRPKTPMPPAIALTTEPVRWAEGDALAAMRNYVAPFADASLQGLPEDWLSRSYEALPRCTFH